MLALAWTLRVAPVGEVASALGQIPLTSLGLALAAGAVGYVAATVRWGLLLDAYGARAVPAWSRLNLLLVAAFHNTFLPGAVVGDLARAHLTRRAFDGGAAGAYMVVFLDRAFGLVGLLLLVSVTQLIRPVAGVSSLRVPAALAVVAALGFIALPFVGRRVGSRVPGRAGAWLQSLPVVVWPVGLFGAVGLSLVTHAALALCTHALLAPLAPVVAVGDSLVLVPIIMVSSYFPVTVAGLGVRELAFIALFEPLGVTAGQSTAASLATLGVLMIYALLGGVLQVVAPVEVAEAPAEA